MKYITILVTLLILVLSTGLSAQRSYHDKMAKMHEAKKEFINKELDFSKEESAKFWVLFDGYHEARHELMIKKRKAYDESKDKADKNPDDVVTAYIAQKEEEMSLHINYLKSLKAALGSQRVLDVERVERRFDKEVMRKLRDRGRGDGSDRKG